MLETPNLRDAVHRAVLVVHGHEEVVLEARLRAVQWNQAEMASSHGQRQGSGESRQSLTCWWLAT